MRHQPILNLRRILTGGSTGWALLRRSTIRNLGKWIYPIGARGATRPTASNSAAVKVGRVAPRAPGLLVVVVSRCAPTAFFAALCFVFVFPSAVFGQAPSSSVEVAVKPDKEWKQYPTRTLADLPASLRAKPLSELDLFGGLRAGQKGTGFFCTQKINGRWWLIDPQGGLFLFKGVASVTAYRSLGKQDLFEQKFGTKSNWVNHTAALLRTNGFNGVGAWSDTGSIRSNAHPVVYTSVWNFMSSYGRKRGGTFKQPGHTGYPKDCLFVFDPGFEKFCDEHAKQLVETKNDPWLLGHFSDNELPLKPGALPNYLSLPEGDFGHQAAGAWLRSRHPGQIKLEDITEADQRDFLSLVVDRYFRIVSRAIKKYDPNHLFLGSRFYGSDLRQPEVFRAAGPHLDVVGVNYYHAWTPDAEKLSMWSAQSGRPILITEWYAKAMDSGLANTSGAGWVVKTQADRGKFYENFTLGLLESQVCVGWHWFKYIDNDPGETTDPTNNDSNKGIVNNRYEPYRTLLDSMKRINDRAYSLVDYFDGTNKSKIIERFDKPK